MITPNERQQLNAYVDGELDLKSQLDIERQLESNATFRRQVDEMRQLREAVREHADYHSAPDALRRRMATLIAASQATPAAPSPARAGAIGEAVQRWLGWRPLAASLSFAAVLSVAVNLVWLQSSRDDRLTDDVVASHVRATLGQHLVDVSSSDHHTVKPFLSSKLGFSPPVSELQIPGSVFLGGRVDYLDGRPVAALVYKQGEHVVNSFVWPSTVSESKPSFSTERGYLTAHWSHNGMNHWVISDVNREEFRTVVDAIATADIDR
ncbi:anti-sigma factor family protein [Piscinibacter sp.]|jgi:anti-sigma factor RsiW|uniref:anti-sigma factor family protein n=1 Tax=Piscinibacter sp. TaxID=1903157 RepID=UPI00355A4355